VVAGLSNGPPDEPLSAAFRRALDGLAVVMERDRAVILARAMLWLEEPDLRARVWEEMERARSLFATLLAARTGRDASDFELQVISMMVLSASLEGMLQWFRQGGRGNLLTFIDRSLSFVDAAHHLDRLEKGR
jgi:hypothetical protein